MTALVIAAAWCVALAAAFELRRREALLRDAAHELRGPLAAISLGLEALRRHAGTRARADFLLAELGRAEAALEDVAAGARGRRAPARVEPIRLEEVVERSSGAWAAAAERAGGGVRVDWPAGPAPIRADPRRLAQAFGNLLANAVEHGGGDVEVRGLPADDAVRVEIADGGPGSSQRGRRAPGRGRGLIIAERALAQAGGRLDSRERPGGGRIVVAEVPLDSAA